VYRYTGNTKESAENKYSRSARISHIRSGVEFRKKFSGKQQGEKGQAWSARRFVRAVNYSSLTLNVNDKSAGPFAYLLIYPSAWMAFFSGEPGSSNPPGILLLIEFPRWNFIPGATLFLAVLSRESISPPSFLASSRLVSSPRSLPSLQSASSQTIVSSCTRRGEFEEKVAQFAQSHEERHTDGRNGSCVRNPHFTPKRAYVHGMQSRVGWRTQPSVCLSTPSRATHPVHAVERSLYLLSRATTCESMATWHSRHVESWIDA